MRQLIARFKPYWRSFVVILWPIVLLPLPIVSGTVEARCGYVILIMAMYWITEAIPMAITSLIPVWLYPLLGVLSTDAVCVAFMNDAVMMFIGSLFAALAIESSKLHMRMAFKMILIMGTSPKKLMFSFMFSTMFLSMWISNAATVAMMMPMIKVILSVIQQSQKNKKEVENNEQSTIAQNTETVNQVIIRVEPDEDSISTKTDNDDSYQESLAYYLGVLYAANLGGAATITGSATNLVLIYILNFAYPEAEGVNFASWMLFNVPVMLMNTILAWIWLQIIYMGLFRGGCSSKKNKTNEESDTEIRKIISERYDELGSMTWHEKSVLTLFIILVLLWFFRQPEFIPGWADLLSEVPITDATPAMGIVFLMFALPSTLDYLKPYEPGRKSSPSLLTWPRIQAKMPWGIVLMLGGGAAMAEGAYQSGVSAWIGTQLSSLSNLAPWLLVSVIVICTTFLTEFMTNGVVATIILTVLAEMAKVLHIHPVYLMMPVAIASSYSFMFPIASSTNAIVSAVGGIKTIDMVRAGLLMNLMTVLVLLLSFNSLGVIVFNLSEYPDWA